MTDEQINRAILQDYLDVNDDVVIISVSDLVGQ